MGIKPCRQDRQAWTLLHANRYRCRKSLGRIAASNTNPSTDQAVKAALTEQNQKTLCDNIRDRTMRRERRCKGCWKARPRLISSAATDYKISGEGALIESRYSRARCIWGLGFQSGEAIGCESGSGIRRF